MEFLSQGYLVRGQGMLFAAFFAIHRCPRGGPVSTVGKLLILQGVATLAVGARQGFTEREAVMLHFLLAFNLLMALQAVDAFLGVDAQLIFVDHGILQPGVALRALACRLDKSLVRLVRFNGGSLPVDQVTGQDQAKTDDNRNKHGTKRHEASRLIPSSIPRLCITLLGSESSRSNSPLFHVEFNVVRS